MKKFNSNKLELMRRERHLTQDELSKELGISRVTVNYWENEKRTPNVYEISRLAKYFNVSEEQLVYDSKSNEAIVRKNTFLALKDLGKDAKWLSEKLKQPLQTVQNWLDSKHAFSRLQIDRIISILKEAGINIIESFESIYSMPISTKIINIPKLSVTKTKKSDFFILSDNEYEDFIELPISLFPDASFVVSIPGFREECYMPDNSYCVIKKMTTPLTSKNMLVKTEQGWLIAKVGIKKGKVHISRFNSDEEIKAGKIEIIGKVCGFVMKED